MDLNLKKLGPWTIYSDPRVAVLVNSLPMDQKLEAPFVRGERAWLPTDDWTERARKRYAEILDSCRVRGFRVEIRGGVAHISHRLFQPLDELTIQTCKRFRIVSPTCAEQGLWHLWRGSHFLFWVETAEPFPESQWYHGVPLINATRIGEAGTYAVLGRMDANAIEIIEKNGEKYLSPCRLEKPDAWVFDMARPRWKTSARAASRHVAEGVANWESYLTLKGRMQREVAAAEAAALYEAEMEPHRRQVEEDVDAGIFDDLL